MKISSSADRQIMLLSAILWMLALLPIMPPLAWNLHCLAHLFDHAVIIPLDHGANDFYMFWAAGHLGAGRDPDFAYQAARLYAFESAHVPKPFIHNPWIYPPPSLLLALLMGRTGLAMGDAVWLFALTLASVVLLRRAKLPWLVIAAICLSPAALFATFIGQLSVLAAALFTFTLMRADDAPGWAGFSAALTMIKPQMALLGPVVLLARRRWRGVAVGAVTALALLALTTLILGPGIWAAYFRYGAPMSQKILLMPFPTFHRLGSHFSYYEFYGSSVFWMLRSLHADLALAAFGQGIAAFAAISYAWVLWRSHAINPINRVAITLLLGVLVSPYGFAEDLAGYSIAIVLLVWQRRRLEIADAILLVWPSFLPYVAIALHAELTPVFVFWAVLRARRELAPRAEHATPERNHAGAEPVS
ncbi:MAG: glycosyltransferase family 87 protein [Acidiphilium sp.]